ncbi:ammonium transporter [Flammeovirga sp. EKP202]|uniref:ammonium transporter n=1 Tax=Flammeovirga sp. EKP202 TaxID=2770592 RepID=UPI00165F1BC5|nr:ammonium transporter [Flammeovirga sp. EKP202]MBD0402902.1 ammonium transporter [Flammeovirga sp. EKP202]
MLYFTVTTISIFLLLPTTLLATETVNTESFNIPDTLWVLLSAFLVFLMQAGFKTLETGLVQKEHRSSVGSKNLMDLVAGVLGFFLVGFGFMFGKSYLGIIGFEPDLFVGQNLHNGDLTIPGIVFFLFQLVFAGTALTIVSGAMSGRTGVVPYFIGSLVTAIVIYPVFGHWAWGNLFYNNNMAWLANMGFMDFAGSTVVHTLGACVGLVGMIMVGPRIGRFDHEGKPKSIKASDYSYSILGVMLLWIGWWGFNGGSTLTFTSDVFEIILNTNVAGASACFSAFFYCYFFQDRGDLIEKMMGGALTGLVAITACCNVVSPMSSLIIGLISGVIHNVGYDLMLKVFKVDDPVGAIPVHGFGGIFGTLCVALFGKQELLILPRWEQLLIQMIGIEVCITFTVIVSIAMFKLIKMFYGLRVSPEQEIKGMLMGRSMPVEFYDVEEEQKVRYVSVKISEKGYNLMDVKDFIALDPVYRLDLLETKKVSFINDQGEGIEFVDAMKQLHSVFESLNSRTTDPDSQSIA